MAWPFEENAKADEFLCGVAARPPVKAPVNGLKSIVFA
jgi:hypothetical protein